MESTIVMLFFGCLPDSGILPCIKVRKNAKVNKKTNHILRNLTVISQKNDLQKWKYSVSYGSGWIDETVFSCKRDRLENMFILLNLRTGYKK
jgi:hypothetical protein